VHVWHTGTKIRLDVGSVCLFLNWPGFVDREEGGAARESSTLLHKFGAANSSLRGRRSNTKASHHLSLPRTPLYPWHTEIQEEIVSTMMKLILIPIFNSLRYGPKISAISPLNFSKASNICQLSQVPWVVRRPWS